MDIKYVVGLVKDICIPVLVAISVWYVSKLNSDRNATSFICDKRQIWIDSLREEISEYLSICLYWAYEKKYIKDDVETAYKTQEESHKDTFSLLSVIRLRLNIKELDCDNLFKELREIREYIIHTSKDELKIELHIIKEIDNIYLLCENILKNEWERVKKETAFPRLLINSLKIKYPFLKLRFRLYRIFRIFVFLIFIVIPAS